MPTYAIDPQTGNLLQTPSIGTLFGYQHTAVAHTGNTNETTLFSVVIPGGTLRPNGVLEVTTLFTLNTTANVKTIRVKFGGVTFLQLAQTTVPCWQQKLIIRNRNAENSQVAAAQSQIYSYGYSTDPVLTSTIDTSVDQTLTVSGQLAVATDTITLESVYAEVLRP